MTKFPYLVQECCNPCQQNTYSHLMRAPETVVFVQSVLTNHSTVTQSTRPFPLYFFTRVMSRPEAFVLGSGWCKTYRQNYVVLSLVIVFLIPVTLHFVFLPCGPSDSCLHVLGAPPFRAN